MENRNNIKSCTKTRKSPLGDVVVYYFISPIGLLQISGTENHITNIQFAENINEKEDNWELGENAKKQLAEYFEGKRKNFDLPLHPQGSDFQKNVWAALQEIPFGETRSYGAIANAIGKAQAARAVGQANNRNPIAIVIPCHRVIGSNKKLIGYAGGLWRKEYLLTLEKTI
jgi:methylated-DNA-[protein]-cysteine S-methyltransferase